VCKKVGCSRLVAQVCVLYPLALCVLFASLRTHTQKICVLACANNKPQPGQGFAVAITKVQHEK